MFFRPTTRPALTSPRRIAPVIAVAATFASALAADAATVTVEVENLSPDQGLFLTPVFVVLHDGGVDLFDFGTAVSDGFERLAEDGSTRFLAAEVNAASPSAIVGATPGGLGAFPPPAVLGPGQTTRITFTGVDPTTNRFLSYATMVIPSNDAFIGNDDPTAFAVFDDAGNFNPGSVTIFGSQVLDAGTELNNEMNAAFFDQSVADAGTPTPGGVVSDHPGFIDSFANPGGDPRILGGTNGMGVTFDAVAADFSLPNYQLARVSVIIPTPAALPAGLLMLAGLIARRRR